MLAPVGARSIIAAMSHLRCLVVSDRFFFISHRVLPRRGTLSESELACLARAINERREEHKFLLTAWVFRETVAMGAVIPKFSLSPVRRIRWRMYA